MIESTSPCICITHSLQVMSPSRQDASSTHLGVVSQTVQVGLGPVSLGRRVEAPVQVPGGVVLAASTTVHTYASCLARASRVASMSRTLVEGSGSPSSGATVDVYAMYMCAMDKVVRTIGEFCKKGLQFRGNALAAKDIRGYGWRGGFFPLCAFEGVKGRGRLGGSAPLGCCPAW